MSAYRYSEWDGTQGSFNLDADELMEKLGKNLLSHGDLSQALRLIQRGGLSDNQGRRLPSIQDLLQQLRQKRQSHLSRYRLGSIMDEIRQKLDNALKTERQGIQRRLDGAEARAGAGELDADLMNRLLKNIERQAARSLEKLDSLPRDVGGRIKELSQYEFMDEDARRQFQELMDMLKRNAMQSYGRELVRKIKDMDARTLAAIRNMVEALNQMLEQRLRGEQPGFEQFMEQYGRYFGEQPPESFDELIERLQEQIAQARSLLDSLSPEDREALMKTLDSALDRGTKYELAQMAMNLEALYPSERLHKEYRFFGEEPISYTEALRLMDTLQKMDRLEAQLRDFQYNRSVDEVDGQLVKELMGNEAAADIDKLRNITRTLEEAGYIYWRNERYELTPRGMRKIGQKALEDIYAQLRKDRVGGHNMKLKAAVGERTDETRRYEFGDDLNIDLEKTIMNSVYRNSQKPPLKLSPEDFEIFKTEGLTQSATVLMLDLSLSMPMHGNFEAAKRVAIALNGLIRTQYPKDRLYIIGFSSYARQVKQEDLFSMGWD